jgi:hypothetical protein
LIKTPRFANLKRTVAEFIISAVLGAILGTIIMTPYVLLVTKMTIEQYKSWVVMEFILVPPVAPAVFWATKLVLKKMGSI